MDDLFLKIIKGEIPSTKIYEDENTFAFLDIRPINKGHTLVVPKIKYRNVFDADPVVLGQMMASVQKVARAVRDGLQADGVTLTMNNEPAGGQDVFHAHIHVIPRYEGDGVFTPPSHETYADGEKDRYAEKIRAALSNA